mgnify:CR=1 FL=1
MTENTNTNSTNPGACREELPESRRPRAGPHPPLRRIGAQGVAAAVADGARRQQSVGDGGRGGVQRPVLLQPRSAEDRQPHHHRTRRQQRRRAKYRHGQVPHGVRRRAEAGRHVPHRCGEQLRDRQLGRKRPEQALARHRGDLRHRSAEEREEAAGRPVGEPRGNLRHQWLAQRHRAQAQRRRPGTGAGDASQRSVRGRGSEVPVPDRWQAGREPRRGDRPRWHALSQRAGRAEGEDERAGRVRRDVARSGDVLDRSQFPGQQDHGEAGEAAPPGLRRHA